ncbi:MAG TPA: PIN domain-containing protein [Terriglobales bacterium]|nr:PIN domain-containing protein [Terriglobales bacterium]
MILADTSVWVRMLAGRRDYSEEMERLLAREEVGGHEMVYGELLVGDRGGRAHWLADYHWLPQAPRLEHGEVVAFVQARGLCGRGVGWVDMHLLAAVLAGGWRLWTADQRLAALAEDLHIGWRPRAGGSAP